MQFAVPCLILTVLMTSSALAQSSTGEDQQPDYEQELARLPDLTLELAEAQAHITTDGELVIVVTPKIANIGTTAAEDFRTGISYLPTPDSIFFYGISFSHDRIGGNAPGIGRSRCLVVESASREPWQPGAQVTLRGTVDRCDGELLPRWCRVRERREDNNQDEVTMTIGGDLVSPPIEDWVITADRLEVREREAGIDNDDPYLMLLPFRVTIASPGSTRILEVPYRDQIGGGARNALWSGIPEALGSVIFTKIKRRSLQDIAAGWSPEVVGVLVVAMTGDATPQARIRELFGRVNNRLRDELEAEIAEETMAADRPEDAFQRIQRHIQDDLGGRILAALGGWQESLAAPDKVIGVDVVAGMTVSQDVVDAFPELDRFQLRERLLKDDGEGALSLRSDKGWYLTAFRVEPFIERPTRARRLIGSVTPSDSASCQDNS